MYLNIKKKCLKVKVKKSKSLNSYIVECLYNAAWTKYYGCFIYNCPIIVLLERRKYEISTTN